MVDQAIIALGVLAAVVTLLTSAPAAWRLVSRREVSIVFQRDGGGYWQSTPVVLDGYGEIHLTDGNGVLRASIPFNATHLCGYVLAEDRGLRFDHPVSHSQVTYSVVC